MWWIGDWLRFGERKYGEMYAQALEATGLDYQTLADAKWVAEQYPEFSLRNENLSWSHHRFAASLPQKQRLELLEKAESEGLSAHEVRRAVHRSRTATKAPDSPPGKYRVIYADPPWRYNDKQQGCRRRADPGPVFSDAWRHISAGALTSVAPCEYYVSFVVISPRRVGVDRLFLHKLVRLFLHKLVTGHTVTRGIRQARVGHVVRLLERGAEVDPVP